MNWKEIGVTIIIVAMIIAVISVFAIAIVLEVGKMRGHYEILSGRVKYELRLNEDGETVWQREE